MREKKLDIIKGFSGILVLWGHTIEKYVGIDFWNDKLHIFIYSFHMPLFMFISGYIYAYSLKKNLIDVVKNRILFFIVPIVFWGAESWIRECILIDSSNFNISNMIVSLTSAGLWFLYSVMFNQLVSGVISRKCINRKEEYILYSIVFLLLTLSCEFVQSMRMITYMFPYFVLGLLVNSREKNNVLKKKIMYLFAMIFPLMLLHYTKNHYIYTTGIAIYSSEHGVINQICINIYRYVIGISGMSFVFLIFDNCSLGKKIEEIFVWIGNRTLQFYCLNAVVIFWLYRLVNKIICISVIRSYYMIHFLIVVITMIESVIISFFIKGVEKKKIVNMIMFGKRKCG